MIIKTAFFVILLFSYTTVSAQSWVKIYDGPAHFHDYAMAVKIDNSGNTYVTGYSYGNGYDYATIKYSPTGAHLWTSRYDHSSQNEDKAYAIALDASRNVYVTGYSTGNGTGQDFCTVKYNTNGVQQWVARYSGPSGNTDVAYAITVDGTGNVYVTGSVSGTNGIDYLTIKYNSAGVMQWHRTYNGPGNSTDVAYAITIDSGNNIIVTGSSYGSSSSTDMATLKYNSAGTLIWTNRFNGAGNGEDEAYAITIDAANNVYITGKSKGSSSSSDYMTIKYSSAGAQLWNKAYNGTGNSDDIANDIQVTPAGDVYVTGTSKSSANEDYLTIKYNTNGTVVWTSRYNGTGNSQDEAYALGISSTMNQVVVTGYSKASVENVTNLVYDMTTGSQLQSLRYTEGKGAAYDIDVNNISVSVAGSIESLSDNSGGINYITIGNLEKEFVQVISNTNTVPLTHELAQNYPNPFNPTTTIKFGLATPQLVRIVIYDMLGRVVQTILNDHLSAGIHTVSFHSSSLSSGVYYYEMTAGDFRAVKEMVLVK